jgi:hypothetical protein
MPGFALPRSAGAAALLAACAWLISTPAFADDSPAEATVESALPVDALARRLQIGDLVFIRVPARPFREVAAATGSWTNHVGIVVGVEDDGEALIAESTFPLSRTTRLSRFVARSDGERAAVARLVSEPTDAQRKAIVEAAGKRAGIFYDTGFNLHSRRQFCSRYVREVLQEATGTQVGEVETFAQLLSRRPDTDLGFWRVWYFGSIPWQRETVTPASVLRSAQLRPVFDGVVTGRQ